MSDLTERLRHAHVHSAQRIMGSNIFEEAADEIERLTAALAEARDKALEEAAKVADEHHWDVHDAAGVVAAAIRKLKEKP